MSGLDVLSRRLGDAGDDVRDFGQQLPQQKARVTPRVFARPGGVVQRQRDDDFWRESVVHFRRRTIHGDRHDLCAVYHFPCVDMAVNGFASIVGNREVTNGQLGDRRNSAGGFVILMVRL